MIAVPALYENTHLVPYPRQHILPHYFHFARKSLKISIFEFSNKLGILKIILLIKKAKLFPMEATLYIFAFRKSF